MLDLVGNPNCWFSHAQAHIELNSRRKVSPAKKIPCVHLGCNRIVRLLHAYDFLLHVHLHRTNTHVLQTLYYIISFKEKLN